MQDAVNYNENKDSRPDDSDADAFAILSGLLVIYLSVSFFLNS